MDDFISKISSVLPKETEIINKEEYFNSAVMLPLVLVDGEYHLLFEKRSEMIRQGGEICFPGGEHDINDESLMSTAIREFTEELGIPVDKLRVAGYLGTLIGPMGVTVDAYIGEIIDYENIELKLYENEVEKVFTMPLKYFITHQPEIYNVNMQVIPFHKDENGDTVDLLPVKELGLPERYSKPWRVRRHKVLVYRTDHEVIWGITAQLVYSFIQKIDKFFP
ncbi:MAG: NUDIX domain-containing protein [Melioribacteraceae bacterium]|nr:NUDIX domain-containing protein [Melioribacteraceae bacterium]MCF8353242.1 NUDIX domain-containing protein [Melioribacteraceae bacterium]MCF8393974.1 NUDIX domain-containing protein [Melioribacteraceae bacterium]MCF8418724.1 NUDIX domain-containing protein [Melioribacteraceae bacterium]